MLLNPDPDPTDFAQLSDAEVERELGFVICRGRGEEHDVRLQQLLVESDRRRRASDSE
jgi:hypothetical protein